MSQLRARAAVSKRWIVREPGISILSILDAGRTNMHADDRARVRIDLRAQHAAWRARVYPLTVHLEGTSSSRRAELPLTGRPGAGSCDPRVSGANTSEWSEVPETARGTVSSQQASA